MAGYKIGTYLLETREYDTSRTVTVVSPCCENFLCASVLGRGHSTIVVPPDLVNNCGPIPSKHRELLPEEVVRFKLLGEVPEWESKSTK